MYVTNIFYEELRFKALDVEFVAQFAAQSTVFGLVDILCNASQPAG
jgi:hypothetical protein